MHRGAALSAGLQPIRQPVFHWRTSAAPGRVVAIGISKVRMHLATLKYQKDKAF